MLLQIEKVLTAEQVAEAREVLSTAPWGDGRDTAGYLSVRVKDNAQLPENHPVAGSSARRCWKIWRTITNLSPPLCH